MNRKQRFAKNMLTLSKKSQARNIAEYCDMALPYLYSAFAIVLSKKGWGYKRISNLFAETDQVWQEYLDSGVMDSILDVCEQKTGIRLMGQIEASQKGVLNANSEET